VLAPAARSQQLAAAFPPYLTFSAEKSNLKFNRYTACSYEGAAGHAFAFGQLLIAKCQVLVSQVRHKMNLLFYAYCALELFHFTG
jgi:hypothetical protein